MAEKKPLVANEMTISICRLLTARQSASEYLIIKIVGVQGDMFT